MADLVPVKLKERLERVLEAVKKDLASIRTGAAKAALVADVKVEAYGTLMSLKELASITAPEPNLIVVTVWDKGLIQAATAGIAKAGLNLNPVVDGEVIKIAVPLLTEERRHELVKQVKQKIESGRVLVRQVRSETKEEIEEQKGQSGVSEDDIKRALASLQQKIDQCMERLEGLEQEKEKELLTL